MAGDVTVANISAALSTSAGGTTNFTKTGFGTPKACRITISFDASDDTGVAAQSKVSIGFSDFTNNFCITHQDEDASAKVDCDALKSNTKAYVVLDVDGSVLFSGTATTTTDGVTLTHTAGEAPTSGFFASVTMYGGADLKIDLVSAAINATQNSSTTPTVTLDDNDDKLIFFIGVDRAQEDSARTGIVNSFGVCHATGNDAGGWTFSQRCMGWSSDHNATEGQPSSIISTNRVLDMITETGGQDWGLEVTDLSASGNTLTLTTRDTGSGAGMEVYLLMLDLDDRKAKVLDRKCAQVGGSWIETGLGFKPQYVGAGLVRSNSIDNIVSGQAAAGVLGISSVTGSGQETCHSWYNEFNAGTINTNNLFRSRAVDLRDDAATTVNMDLSFSSFDSGGWTYTVNTRNGDADCFVWTVEEAAAVVAVPGYPRALFAHPSTLLRM